VNCGSRCDGAVTEAVQLAAGVTIYCGDCRDILPTLADGSVHCCVTSPPYWGLRDYGCDGQIGLERTPEEYVAALVAVFREVRRVLKDDGTLWLNLGDSYASSGTSGHQRLDVLGERLGCGGGHKHSSQDCGRAPTPPGLKQKDLVGIPWRVAFALQADGWYLRQDIIWAKPNPMPESVTDRCTKSHEYVFLLAKSPRYYYDAEAVAEPVAATTVQRLGQATLAQQAGSDRVPGKTNGPMKAVPPRFGGNKYGDCDAEEHRTKSGNAYDLRDGRRNRRSVWTVATQPYSGAHFAVFPSALILPCILAGCPPGGVVLDPFGGSGTTGQVATGNGRRAILIELNPAYGRLAKDRCGLFCVANRDGDDGKGED